MALHKGTKITPLRFLLNYDIDAWKYSNECDDIGIAGLILGAELEVVDDCRVPGAIWTCVKLPGPYPPKFLKMTGEEYAHNFRVK